MRKIIIVVLAVKSVIALEISDFAPLAVNNNWKYQGSMLVWSCSIPLYDSVSRTVSILNKYQFDDANYYTIIVKDSIYNRTSACTYDSSGNLTEIISNLKDTVYSSIDTVTEASNDSLIGGPLFGDDGYFYVPMFLAHQISDSSIYGKVEINDSEYLVYERSQYLFPEGEISYRADYAQNVGLIRFNSTSQESMYPIQGDSYNLVQFNGMNIQNISPVSTKFSLKEKIKTKTQIEYMSGQIIIKKYMNILGQKFTRFH